MLVRGTLGCRVIGEAPRNPQKTHLLRDDGEP